MVLARKIILKSFFYFMLRDIFSPVYTAYKTKSRTPPLPPCALEVALQNTLYSCAPRILHLRKVMLQ